MFLSTVFRTFFQLLAICTISNRVFGYFAQQYTIICIIIIHIRKTFKCFLNSFIILHIFFTNADKYNTKHVKKGAIFYE